MHQRSAARALVLGAAALVLLALPAAAPAQRATAAASFYTPPASLPKGPHGTLIRKQKVARSDAGYLSAGAATYRVLHTSQALDGKRIVVSGLVTIPKGTPPKGGWKVISWAHGTTGTADVCGPSRVTNAASIAPYVTYVNPELNAWLKRGYAIARTDFEGLGVPGAHPYLVGGSEARGVLDVVRAARRVDRRISATFAIAGHSQGGHAALFAGAARSWTPELRLRGVAAYAPASHILEQAQLLPSLTQPSGLSGLAILILTGASSTTTKLSIPTLLSDPGLALYPQVDRACLDKLSAARSFGGLAPSTLIRPGGDSTELYRVLGEMNPAVSIKVPTLMLQGLADTTVFPNFTADLETELKARGVSLTYRTYPGVDHAGIVKAANADATAFLRARLR